MNLPFVTFIGQERDHHNGCGTEGSHTGRTARENRSISYEAPICSFFRSVSVVESESVVAFPPWNSRSYSGTKIPVPILFADPQEPKTLFGFTRKRPLKLRRTIWLWKCLNWFTIWPVAWEVDRERVCLFLSGHISLNVIEIAKLMERQVNLHGSFE